LAAIRRHWLFVAVFSVLVLVRVSAYQHVNGAGLSSPNIDLYLTAIRDHLGEYLWFTTLKPPLTYLVQGIVVRLFSNQAIYTHAVFVILVYAMDLAAACLIYLSAMELKVHRSLAAIVIGIYSIAYLPLEHWWFGWHYDQYTLFFTALFVFGLCRLFRRPTLAGLIGLSCAAGLLVAQSTVNSLVVPIATGVAMLVMSREQGWTWRATAARFTAACLVPVLVIAVLVIKNHVVAGVAATSNLAGMATIMVVARAEGRDTVMLREAVVESRVPRWYQWCFDHPQSPLDPEGKPYAGWDLHARESGICYPWTEMTDEFWPHDFRPLRAKLAEFGETDLVRIIDKDIADTRDRRYLFAGVSPNASARWIGAYSAVSLRVYRHYVLSHPAAYLATVRELNTEFRSGAEEPALLQGPDGTERAELAHLKGLIVPVGTVYRYLMLFGYWLLVAGWAYLFLRALASRSIAAARRWPGPQDGAIQAFMVLSLPAILLTVIFSSQVERENHRYFYQITPYLCLIVMLVLSHVARRLTGTTKEAGIGRVGGSAGHAGGALQRGAGVDGLGQEILHGRCGLRANEHLIREQTLAHPNEQDVQPQQRAADGVVPQRFRIGSRYASDFEDLVTGLIEQLTQTTECEESRVRAVENALPPVVELAEQVGEPHDEEADVRGGQYDFRPASRGRLTQRLHEYLGIAQVLDHVEQENLVELGDVDREGVGIQIPAMELEVLHLGSLGDVLIDARHAPRPLRHEGGHGTLPTSDVENAAAGLHRVDGVGMRGRKTHLEIVCVFHEAGIELPVVEKVHPVELRAHHRAAHVPRVLHSVDAADFVPVVRRNWQLEDAQIRQYQLDDDLRVEMKIVAVAFERNAPERVGRVHPVAGVELGQVRPEKCVLEGRQNPVAEELIERHPAAKRPATLHHARAEHGVGLMVEQRLEKGRQLLGGVLAVSVQECDDVEPVIDRVAVAQLLVPAVALVLRSAEHRDAEIAGRPFVRQPGRERIVLREVVDDQDFDVPGAQARRNAVQHAGQRRLGVVRDDEDEDALLRGIASHTGGSLGYHRVPEGSTTLAA
jgi:hypothetical protein